ncbi:LysR family transcriptional regulator [Ligilactobacillus acidipiscis]|uniref:LysR family transcriptional regulator n=1 Tax=Ligilactobacillus acidipiscis TaxID=89059 RepID=UPI0022E6AE89|nr:LysR family transcriptional regulator [Ligilactobacillus acidipiscis]
MNLNQLQCFSVVAHHESITKAAQELYISEPAVSKMIKQLESILSVQLFDRAGRSLHLNDSGKLFLSYVDNSLEELERGVIALKNQAHEQEEQFSILFQVGSDMIGKIATQIHHSLPKIRLQISQKLSQENDKSKYDMILTSEKIPDFFCVPILTEDILIGIKKSDAPQKHSIDFNDLYNYSFVGLSTESQLRRTVDKYFEQTNLMINYKYEADVPSTVRQMMKSGVGASFVPAVTWQDVGHKLHLLKIKNFPLQRTIYVCTPKQKLTENQRKVTNQLFDLFVQSKKDSLFV